MEVKVPDIGDFDAVPVIEILVAVGDEVGRGDPLVVLESDKATMEVPSPAAGKVTSIEVAVGDKVAEGTLIVQLEAAEADVPPRRPKAARRGEARGARAGLRRRSGPAESPASPTTDAPTSSGIPEDADVKVQVAVFGAGPGGYTAAFRAADLGLSVALIDKGETLGGVCLNVGCIPSKALLHVAKVLTEAEELAESGISFGKPTIDLDHVRGWKNDVVGRLVGGLENLAKQRKVEVVRGSGEFTSPNSIKVGDTVVGFEHCIIASGSEAASLPFLPEDPRIMDSTGALEVEEIPERLLVIGGGIIGLEMATVYDALGSKVTVVELLDQLIPGADKDLVRVLEKRIKGRYEAIHLKTGVESVEAGEDGLKVKFGRERRDVRPHPGRRRPPAQRQGHRRRSRGRDRRRARVHRRPTAQMKTNVPHIFSIGDVRGEPMLAHKATHEGVLAAEVIAGHDVTWDVRSIPSVAYTDPELAWTGLTETQAKADGIEYEVGAFPWAASGRALGMGRSDGLTKLIVEPGRTACSARASSASTPASCSPRPSWRSRRASTPRTSRSRSTRIRPCPRRSGFSAEMAEGTITDIMPKRKRPKA